MSAPSVRDLFDLSGKVALVTGGAGVIGRRCCVGLAEFGADVAVVDRDADGAAETAAEIERRHDRRALAVAADVADPEAVRRMTERVVEELGGIDILHNNAAGKSDDPEAFFRSFEDYDPDQWRAIMAVNLDAMFLVAQAVGRRMIDRGRGGSIVQTSSIYGLLAPDFRIYEGSGHQGRPVSSPAVYSASKAGVVGLTRYLAVYWARHGIRVNALAPGGVESGQNQEFQRRYGARVPLGRMAHRDEIVGALLFLASDASSYVTGQTLVVDGGLSAR